MKNQNMWTKILEGSKRAIVGASLVGTFALGGFAYYKGMEDFFRETNEMASSISNSPRKQYVVQKGENLWTLRKMREDFYSIREREFVALDNKWFAMNQGEWRESLGGQKKLTADNIWTNRIIRENKIPFYNVFFQGYGCIQEGDTLTVPYRE